MKRKIDKEQLLSAHPARHTSATIDSAGDGRWHLKVPLRPTKWARLILRLPQQSTRTFELDELGKTFWESCDGKMTLGEIIDKLASQYNLDHDDAEGSTIAFAHTLVQKGLIAMAMKDD